MIRFVIPGTPHAQKRHRSRVIAGHAQMYDHPDSRAWKGVAQVHMLESLDGRGPFDGAVRVYISAVFPLPKGKHRKRKPRGRSWHTGRKDVDNIAKAVMDAGNGVLWGDDGQVCSLEIVKIVGAQGEASAVAVTVSALDDIR